MNSLPPYADLLGLSLVPQDEGAPLLVMPFHDDVVGRPNYLHGGAIAGLLEMAGWSALRHALGEEKTAATGAKPVTVTVDYLRGAGASRGDTHARGKIKRLGKRLANVEVTAWQQDEAKPVAQAHIGYLLDRKSTD